MKNVCTNCFDTPEVTGAYTIKPLAYTTPQGEEIVVPVNEYILVDINEGVALVGEQHITISEDEYEAVHQ